MGLAGCATPRLQAPVEPGFAGLPQRVELAAIPFHAQTDFQCGPAALAMALGAAGKTVDPEALKPQVYVPGRRGSFQAEMLAATRRNGLVAVEVKTGLSGLLAEVAAGNPVIVLQNLAFAWYPAWHYALAVGYDLERERIVLRSGEERRHEMGFAAFERTWRRGGNWAMLALVPGQMPASVTAYDYLKAVTTIENTGPLETARAAYERALERWPANLTALVGLGNTAYRVGDFEAAEAAFRRAVSAHPFSVAARNNLAQTLIELGRDEEALAQARIAVGLGGQLEDISLRTLDAIASRTGRGEQEWHQ